MTSYNDYIKSRLNKKKGTYIMMTSNMTQLENLAFTHKPYEAFEISSSESGMYFKYREKGENDKIVFFHQKIEHSKALEMFKLYYRVGDSISIKTSLSKDVSVFKIDSITDSVDDTEVVLTMLISSSNYKELELDIADGMCKFLKDSGYNHVAQDKNGEVFAYNVRPAYSRWDGCWSVQVGDTLKIHQQDIVRLFDEQFDEYRKCIKL